MSVAFDLPTQIGYDSDFELSEVEVGKVGVAIDTLADKEMIFDGILLDKVKYLDDDQLPGGRPAGHVCGGSRKTGGLFQHNFGAHFRTMC